MPRRSKRAIDPEKLEIMREIIEGYKVQRTADLQEALKDLLGRTIETIRTMRQPKLQQLFKGLFQPQVLA